MDELRLKAIELAKEFMDAGRDHAIADLSCRAPYVYPFNRNDLADLLVEFHEWAKKQ